MGLNLTGWSSAKRSNKERRRTEQAIDDREKMSLGELTPEAMQAMMQMFYSKYMALLAPQMMGAQQRLGATAARGGMTGSGLMAQLKAGIPGQFANMALGQAIEPSLRVASERAGIRKAKPIQFRPTRSHFGDLMGVGATMWGGNNPETLNPPTTY
jgi:hypothetical protein